VSLDPEQRAAAEAPASVVVSAGAGTGKTHMLARRYLHHLRQGLRPLEVVAVTFTRRAAEELRARIRDVVADATAADGAVADGAGVRLDADVVAADGAGVRLDADMVAEVEVAPIGTIHALAQLVCRRYPEAADVPPDFGVVDELDAQVWVAEALDEALERLRPDEVDDLPYDLLRAALAAALEDPTRARDALAVTSERVQASLGAARRAAFDACVGASAWADDVAFLGSFAGPPGHEAESARARAWAAAARLQDLGPDGDPQAAAVAWADLASLPAHRGAKKGWFGPDLATVKAALRRLRDAARAAWDAGEGPVGLAWTDLDERAAAHVARLRGALARGLAVIDERKRRAKALTFADLETHALRALADPEVRAHLQLRWRALLVDEVQDVNPTQARLLAALRSADAPLTAVGDAKQSIYGFRGAEPSVLANLLREVSASAGGRTVRLRTNYRSHRAIVDVVNRVFDRVWGDEAGPLAAVRAPLPGLPPVVRYLRIERSAGARSAALAAAEAAAVGDAILGWVRRDPPVLVPDGRGGERPLGFGDVAVLARGHGVLEALEARLPARGVPVLNAGGGDVLGTQEGRDARALLRAVVDPTDGVAVAALLRSPYVAAHDADVARFAHVAATAGGSSAVGAAATAGGSSAVGAAATPPRPWWRRLPSAPAAPAEEGLARAGDLLRALRRARAGGAPASALLRLADELSGFRAVLAHLPHGARRVADHDGMVALLERLEGGHADALGVVRRLERLVATGVKVPRPPLRAHGAVALLTIHAAKGLEWPAVVLVDLAGAGGRDGDDVLLDPDVGFALRWPDGRGGRAVPATYRYAAAAARRRDEAERRRLAYVAFTRARELLLVSDRGGPAAGLRGALGAALDADGVVHEAVPFDTTVAPIAPLPPAPAPPDPDDPSWRRSEPGPPAAHPAPGSDRGWRAVRRALGRLDGADAWAATVSALGEAGVPAPDATELPWPLELEGRPTGRVAGLAWRLPGGRIVVVDAGDGGVAAFAGVGFDGVRSVVGLDPSDPEAVVAAVVAAWQDPDRPGSGTAPVHAAP
jgi:ATP-dependent helicase/nuclease subunit A